MTEPCHLSAVEARRLIGQKKLSPVELMQSCLKRIEVANPAINAVVAMDEQKALADARDAERVVMNGGHLDVLHGLPVGIKDLHACSGLNSTWGSLLFKDNVPENDDALVQSVRIAGGSPFCMTNVPEFGAGGNSTNRVYGATGNPFDPNLTASGSSGGSAAALALDMMPLATGSDYGGSLRTPAGFCGVVGVRTSTGLVPSPDKTAGLIPWGVLGPMGRCVADAYLLLRAMLTVDRRDPFSSMDAMDWPERLDPADLATVRLAYTEDFGQCPVAENIRKTFRARVPAIGAPFRDATEETPDFSGIHDLFEVHRGLAFVAGHQEKLAKHRALLNTNVIDNTERGLKLTVDRIGRGFVEQSALMKRFHAFFDDYDVLVAPAASVSPFPHTELYPREMDGVAMDTYMRWLAISYAPTMALCCAVALPCGLDDRGLPFGIQLIAPRGHDRRLLEVALALESVLASNSETRRPVPQAIATAKKPAAKAAKPTKGRK